MNPFLTALAVIVVTLLIATNIPKKTPAKNTIHTENVEGASISATPIPTVEKSDVSIQHVTTTPTPTPTLQQNENSTSGSSSRHTSVTVNGKTIQPDANGNVNYDDGQNSVHVNGSSSTVNSNSSQTNIHTNIQTSVNTSN